MCNCTEQGFKIAKVIISYWQEECPVCKERSLRNEKLPQMQNSTVALHVALSNLRYERKEK